MTPIRKFLFWLTYLLILPGLLILFWLGEIETLDAAKGAGYKQKKKE